MIIKEYRSFRSELTTIYDAAEAESFSIFWKTIIISGRSLRPDLKFSDAEIQVWDTI
jgi:hypothetical protein